MSFLQPERFVRLSGSPEKASSYSESAMWEKYAKEQLVSVESGRRIDFDGTDRRGLVAKLTDLYKDQGYDDAKSKKAAMGLTGRLVMKAGEMPGFDVNYFRKGDSLRFLPDEKVMITYTPRGSVAPMAVAIDYGLLGVINPEHMHIGTIDRTRAALEGQRKDVLLEACKRETLYNVVSVLGYRWGNTADMADFWINLSELGLSDAKMKELAPSLRGSAQKNVAACRFIKEMIGNGVPIENLMKNRPRSTTGTAPEAPVVAPVAPTAAMSGGVVPLSTSSAPVAVPTSGLWRPPAEYDEEKLLQGEDIMSPEIQWERLKAILLDTQFATAEKAGITHEILETPAEIRATMPRSRMDVGSPSKAIKFSKDGEDWYVLIYRKPIIERGTSYLRLESSVFNEREGVVKTSGEDFIDNVRYVVDQLGETKPAPTETVSVEPAPIDTTREDVAPSSADAPVEEPGVSSEEFDEVLRRLDRADIDVAPAATPVVAPVVVSPAPETAPAEEVAPEVAKSNILVIDAGHGDEATWKREVLRASKRQTIVVDFHSTSADKIASDANSAALDAWAKDHPDVKVVRFERGTDTIGDFVGNQYHKLHYPIMMLARKGKLSEEFSSIEGLERALR
ncbi:MAG: hypothetical protein UV80_C0010G0006 [Candidatus Peregrinibacteria bacterium GW2011_GWF2_43_17]|nr:MAG: hypothetical protein UV80_C0010G0006 [Candidatus Peregrinibacteria bacterium GW2011_GWF2_43_17]HAU39378.1 hypothetical protein [Candidatus Peregrinibacteria bacterium]